MSRMNEFSVEEALRQFRSFRDDQFRANLAHDRRIKALDTENQELKLRLSVLTRLLISKGVMTAAEIAACIVEAETETKARQPGAIPIETPTTSADTDAEAPNAP